MCRVTTVDFFLSQKHLLYLRLQFFVTVSSGMWSRTTWTSSAWSSCRTKWKRRPPASWSSYVRQTSARWWWLVNAAPPAVFLWLGSVHHSLPVVSLQGDNMLTAISVARDCGMVRSQEKVVVADATPPKDFNPACITWQHTEEPALDASQVTLRRGQFGKESSAFCVAARCLVLFMTS